MSSCIIQCKNNNNINQPALSRTIYVIEVELNVLPFERRKTNNK